MSKTNCINCGAAKDTSEIKCPFCGTTYLDFTAIDFTSHEPVVCEFVMPWSKERTIMSMLALPILDEFSVTTSPLDIDITSLGDYFKSYVSAPPEVNVCVSFRPLVRNGNVFSIRKE